MVAVVVVVVGLAKRCINLVGTESYRVWLHGQRKRLEEFSIYSI